MDIYISRKISCASVEAGMHRPVMNMLPPPAFIRRYASGILTTTPIIHCARVIFVLPHPFRYPHVQNMAAENTVSTA